MMKTKYIMLALALALGSLAAMAQTQDDDQRVRDKITEAVMRVYNKHLAENPGDYNTMFARANQYYYNGQIDEALADVNTILTLIPAQDNDLRFETMLLRARLYDIKGDYAQEIIDLKAANGLNPSSPAVNEPLAKAYLNSGDPDNAETYFKAVLRNQPLDYNAMYGLARVEVARGNYEQAAAHADKAVNLYSAEPQVYMNRADVLTRMEQFVPAAQDLISAMAIGDDNGEALSALVAMSDKNYDAVMSALANSIDKAPRVGMFYYVRSSIAMKHFHYGQALKDLKSIIDYNLYDYHTIYYNAARCQLELMQYDDALANINKAIAMEQSTPDYYLVKAAAERYRGRGNNFENALLVLDDAAKLDGQYLPTMLARARVLIAQKKDRDALAQLDAAVAAHPDAAEARLLRGWLYKYRLKDATMAAADFQEMLLRNDDTMHNLRGFAMHELGRDEDARAWAKAIIDKGVMPGGECYYYASALLSDMGDEAQAIDYLRSALANGYGSLFEVKVNEDPYVNLKLVRRAADFNSVVEQNQQAFQERR